MRYIIRGASLVYGSPRLWKYIITPMLLGLLVLIAVGVASYWLIVPRIDTAITSRFSGSTANLLELLASLLFIVLFILTSGFLYLTIVSFLSSMLWENLSFEVEKQSTGREVSSKFSNRELLGDAIVRGLFALSFGLLSLCCGWPLAGIPGILIAGWIGLHDYTAAAYTRRGLLFSGQRERLRFLPVRFQFIVVGGLLTLLPFINVLMLPALVAGGTLMVIDSEADGVKPSTL